MAHDNTEPSTVQTINSSLSRVNDNSFHSKRNTGSSNSLYKAVKLAGDSSNAYQHQHSSHGNLLEAGNGFNMMNAVNDRMIRLDNQVSSLPSIDSHRSSLERPSRRSVLPDSLNLHTSHKIMNGAFDNYITGTNEKKIPTTNSRRNFSKNESNLKQRPGGIASKRGSMTTEGADKLLALENLYFRSNIPYHQRREGV